MASGSKQGGKMINFINHRFRVTLKDGRQLVGYMSAFDKHMNLVLADCEEYRRVKRKAKATGAPGAGQHGGYVETEEKRVLGFVILRGAHVVSTTVEGPPLSDPSARLGTSAPGGAAATLQTGPGISRPAGRGAGIGLQGPAAGVGGPGFAGAGFPPQQPGYGIPRGVPPMGFAPAVGLPPGGPPGFQPPTGFPPQGGRGFQGPPGGYPGR